MKLTKKAKECFENKIIYYSGFSEPKVFRPLEQLEDYTKDDKRLTYSIEYLIEEMNAWAEDTDESIRENQPFFHPFFLWFSPTKEQLEEFNESVLLDKEDYITEFYEALDEVGGVIKNPVNAVVVETTYHILLKCPTCQKEETFLGVGDRKYLKKIKHLADLGENVVKCTCNHK